MEVPIENPDGPVLRIGCYAGLFTASALGGVWPLSARLLGAYTEAVLSKSLALIALIVFPALGATASLDALKAAIASGEQVKLMQALQVCTRELRAELTEEQHARSFRESMQEARKTNPAPELGTVVAELERAWAGGELEAAYRKLLLIMAYSARTNRAAAPDPMVALDKAREAAKADPSFPKQFGLMLAANLARQYNTVVEAAEKAIEIGKTDRLAARSADLWHEIYTMQASAYWELGKRELAGQALLASLDTGNLAWSRPCPDTVVAARMWNEGARATALAYWERVASLRFAACQAPVELWIAEMKAGKTPSFRLP
jgi:tetratricopeptide (TPR) repeat protein